MLKGGPPGVETGKHPDEPDEVNADDVVLGLGADGWRRVRRVVGRLSGTIQDRKKQDITGVAEVNRSMRQNGTIRSWNDKKGCGFISSSDVGKDIFLHISAFSNRDRRPEVGQNVAFALETDAQGRPRANKATLPGDRLHKAGGRSGKAGAFFVAISFLALAAISVFVSKIPALILWLYLAVSLVTYLVYAFDKTAPKDGAWRTSEGTLHWLALLGGWPGALVAQHTLRHKSKKQSFRLVFWITVILNVGAFVWIFTPEGAGAVQSWIG